MKKGHPSRSFWNLFIYPAFQFAVFFVIAATLLVSLLVTRLQMVRSLEVLKNAGQGIQLAPDHPFFALIESEFQRTYLSLSVSLAVAFTISCAVILVLSHRLAGPVVRMKNYFRGLAEGQASEPRLLRFRQGDFFGDLPEMVNRALKNSNPKGPKD